MLLDHSSKIKLQQKFNYRTYGEKEFIMEVLLTQQNPLNLLFFIPEFLKQLQFYSEEFRRCPLLKLWIGPLPLLILYHPDNVEVSACFLSILLSRKAVSNLLVSIRSM